MDNRKWYKKFATIFWWTLMSMPILIIILVIIGTLLNIKEQNLSASDLQTYIDSTINSSTFYSNTMTIFNNISISYLITTFSKLTQIIGVTNYNYVGIILGYMCSIAMYHLLFDLLVFFIHLLHSYTDCERWQR